MPILSTFPFYTCRAERPSTRSQFPLLSSKGTGPITLEPIGFISGVSSTQALSLNLMHLPSGLLHSFLHLQLNHCYIGYLIKRALYFSPGLTLPPGLASFTLTVSKRPGNAIFGSPFMPMQRTRRAPEL